MSGRIHAWQLNSSSTCSVYTVMWCFYPLLGALRHWSYTVWRAEEHARLIFHFLGGCKTVASNIYFHVCACIWEIVSFANHQVQKSQGSEFHKHVSRKEISHKKQRFYRRFWCFVYSLWGCKEWSCWIASKHFYCRVTLSATMASTWRRLVSDGHRLGRQWLQGKLSEETATSLRQLVVDSGAASSSRATKGESLAILFEMFDRSSPVSRRLWCFSWCFFLLFTLHLQRLVCFCFAYQLYFRNNFMLQLGFWRRMTFHSVLHGVIQAAQSEWQTLAASARPHDRVWLKQKLQQVDRRTLYQYVKDAGVPFGKNPNKEWCVAALLDQVFPVAPRFCRTLSIWVDSFFPLNLIGHISSCCWIMTVYVDISDIYE